VARAFQPAPFCTFVTPRAAAAFTFFRIMKNAIIGTALCFFALSLFAQGAIPLGPQRAEAVLEQARAHPLWTNRAARKSEKNSFA